MHWLKLVVVLRIFYIFLWPRISKLLDFAGKNYHRVHLRGKTHESYHQIPNSFKTVIFIQVCLGPDDICNMIWNEWKGHENKDFEIIEQDSRIFFDWNGMKAIFLSFLHPYSMGAASWASRDGPKGARKKRRKNFFLGPLGPKKKNIYWLYFLISKVVLPF